MEAKSHGTKHVCASNDSVECAFSQEILQIKHAAKTHISSDHNVEADGKRFVKPPIFGPVLCLEIFGKSALKDNKRQVWLSKRLAHWLRGHWEVMGRTWSCNLWRRRSWRRARPVAWKNTSEHKVQRSSPGYTSTQRSFLFLLPESEQNKQLWGSILMCLCVRLKRAWCEWEWRRWGSDLVRQLSDRLSSIVQHVSHTEYGAERVLLWVVVALLNLLSRHGGGKIPSETETFGLKTRNKPTFGLCVCSFGRAGWWTHLVTLKSGKRTLFLMKMVKLFTSSMGLLGRTTEEDRWGGQAIGFQDLRVHILHLLVFLLSRAPPLDLTLALGSIGGVIGWEADSRNCTCVMENQERWLCVRRWRSGQLKGLKHSSCSPLVRMEPKLSSQSVSFLQRNLKEVWNTQIHTWLHYTIARIVLLLPCTQRILHLAD